MSNLVIPEAATTELIDEIAKPPGGELRVDINLDEYDFVPWAGRFLVKEFPPDEMTSGKEGTRLHIPDSAKERKCWGRVLSVGSEISDVDIGAIILFNIGAGTDLSIVGEGLRLMDYRDDFENDVLGTFVKKRGLDGEGQADE